MLMLIGRNPRRPPVVAAIDSSLTMLMAIGGWGFWYGFSTSPSPSSGTLSAMVTFQ